MFLGREPHEWQVAIVNRCSQTIILKAAVLNYRLSLNRYRTIVQANEPKIENWRSLVTFERWGVNWSELIESILIITLKQWEQQYTAGYDAN